MFNSVLLSLLLFATAVVPTLAGPRQNRPQVDYTFQKVAFPLGDSIVYAHLTQAGSSPLTMVNLHEDEQTSVEAGRAILEKYGGRLIQFVHSGKRRIVFSLDQKEYSFDPNRIFSKAGVRKTLTGEKPIPDAAYEAVDRFSAQFIRQFDLKKRRTLITLHNNGEGGLSIHTYEPGGDWAADTDKLHVGKNADPDNFYFVTDKRFYEEFKNRDFNVILQDNTIKRDDGSLSVFAGRHKIPYINVEAQDDHLEEQIRMLDLAVQISR